MTLGEVVLERDLSAGISAKVHASTQGESKMESATLNPRQMASGSAQDSEKAVTVAAKRLDKLTGRACEVSQRVAESFKSVLPMEFTAHEGVPGVASIPENQTELSRELHLIADSLEMHLLAIEKMAESSQA